jgi:hypothetical protein
MDCIFCEAKNFNQPIGEWDITSVTEMNSMFDYADNFNYENAPWYNRTLYENAY